MAQKPVYRVIFINNGKTYEIYANKVSQGGIYGFVEIEGLMFNERSSLLVDPAEEKLKAEFEGVDNTNIPVHSIIRIDQVKKLGTAKISEVKGDVVTAFPFSKPDNPRAK